MTEEHMSRLVSIVNAYPMSKTLKEWMNILCIDSIAIQYEKSNERSPFFFSYYLTPKECEYMENLPVEDVVAYTDDGYAHICLLLDGNDETRRIFEKLPKKWPEEEKQ